MTTQLFNPLASKPCFLGMLRRVVWVEGGGRRQQSSTELPFFVQPTPGLDHTYGGGGGEERGGGGEREGGGTGEGRRLTRDPELAIYMKESNLLLHTHTPLHPLSSSLPSHTHHRTHSPPPCPPSIIPSLLSSLLSHLLKALSWQGVGKLLHHNHLLRRDLL